MIYHTLHIHTFFVIFNFLSYIPLAFSSHLLCHSFLSSFLSLIFLPSVGLCSIHSYVHYLLITINVRNHLFWGVCMLFNDTWYQLGHSVSWMAILSSLLANHQRRHQAAIKWAVSLVLADGHFNVNHGLSVDMYGLTTHCITPDVLTKITSFLTFCLRWKSMRRRSICNNCTLFEMEVHEKALHL